jgi:hypothetical protein
LESEDGLLIYFEAWYTLSAEDREKQTMDWISDPQAWIAFSTLLALEVILGSTTSSSSRFLPPKLPAFEQTKARYLGLTLPGLHELQHPGRHVYIARKPRCPESVIDFISPGPERISA